MESFAVIYPPGGPRNLPTAFNKQSFLMKGKAGKIIYSSQWFFAK